MKKNIIFSLLAICAIFILDSCQIDNYDGPNQTFSGDIIDSTTGLNIVTSDYGIQLKIWQISWSATPAPQTLNVMDDGSFNNTMLFAGTYKIVPTNGAFWPAQDSTTVVLKGGNTHHNFTVTPYLELSITNYQLDTTSLTISGTIDAPIADGLPAILDIRPFVSTTSFVGNSSNISNYSDPFIININDSFANVKGKIYTMTIRGLKSGNTFYVRLGARVNDSFKNYDYSKIVIVKVP